VVREAEVIIIIIKLRGMSPRANTDRMTPRLSAKLVPTFGDRGYRVVIAKDPYGRNLRF
jgi:hypothetical protein